jgi:hypothetical protein
VRTGDNVFVKTEHRVMFPVQDFTTASGKERLWGTGSSKTMRGSEGRAEFYLNRL